jgi:very-short-patch-repair endonuclease
VATWWARRQWSKGSVVPYEVGQYRSDWSRYPVLIRQFHPDLNSGIVLSQVPPAADVFLVWECDVGHRFVATPEEQRARPGGPERRRSAWCPECARLAVDRSVREPAAASEEIYSGCGHAKDERRIEAADETRCPLCRRLDSSRFTREELVALAIGSQRDRLASESLTGRRYRWQCDRGHPSWEAPIAKVLEGRRCRVCRNAAVAADRVAVGEPFVSPHAPAIASAAEAELRQRIGERYLFDLAFNAVRVAQPFFAHLEVWPDIVIPELRIAVEYDTIGRFGLEHVGRTEPKDRRKDRMLRAVGWEVVRLRLGKLQPLGPFDVVCTGLTDATMRALDDAFGRVRGDLFVAAYRR